MLFVSNGVEPAFIARSVAGAADAKAALGGELGGVVLMPMAAGAVKDRSYALWPWRRDLASSGLRRTMQVRRLRPRVFEWLMGVAGTTAVEVDTTELYQRPLEWLAARDDLPDTMRQRARSASERLRESAWRPRGVLAHNDCWLGNVLLPSDATDVKNPRYPFFVVDWAGARLHGHPYFDLVRFAASVGVGGAPLGKLIGRYAAALDDDRSHAIDYVLAALGAVGLEPGHFPEDRFAEMCVETYDRIRGAVS